MNSNRESDGVMKKSTDSNDPDRISRWTIVATLLRVEAVAVLSLGAFLIIKSFFSDAQAPGALRAEVIFAFLGGIGLLGAARGFSRRKNYGRAPAILANAIALGVCGYQIQAHMWWLAIPQGVVALVVLLLALSLTPDKLKEG